MSSRLKITLLGESIDLIPGTEDNFYITGQLFDLTELANRKSTFARRITLPLSPKNAELFQFPVNLASQNDLEYQRLAASVYVDGVPVLDFAEFVVSGSSPGKTTTFNVNIFGDNFSLFERISDLKLSQLDLSDLRFNADYDTVLGLMQDISGQYTVVSAADSGGNTQLTFSTTFNGKATGVLWVDTPDIPAGFYSYTGGGGSQVTIVYPFPGNQTSGTAKHAKDAGLTCPYLDYMDFATGQVNFLTEAFVTYYNVRFGGFALGARQLIERIITQAGYQLIVTGALDTDATFNNVALIQAYTQFLIENPLAAFGSVQNNATQNVVGAAERAVFQVPGTVNNITWNGTLNQYEVINPAILDITLTATSDFVNRNNLTGSQLRLYLNGGVIATYDFPDATGTYPSNISASNISVAPADIIYIEIFAASGVGQPEQITLNPGATFVVAEPSGLTLEVNPQSYVPRLTQKEFLKGILQMFGAVIDVNNTERTATIGLFSEVIGGSIADSTDLSNNIDSSQGEEIDNITEGLGIVSRFRYSDDPTVARRDYNAAFIAKNKALTPEKTVITLPFAPSDNSLYGLNTNQGFEKMRYPQFTLTIANENSRYIGVGGSNEIQCQDESGNPTAHGAGVGDYLLISVTGIYRRIDLIKSETNFEIAGPALSLPTARRGQILRYAIGNEEVRAKIGIVKRVDNTLASRFLYDGFSETGSVGAQPDLVEAQFNSDLFYTTLLTNYYPEILATLDKLKRVRVWAVIPAETFANLDLKALVYIDKYQRYFYVNKIEQWKVTALTRLELFQVPTDIENLEIVTDE